MSQIAQIILFLISKTEGKKTHCAGIALILLGVFGGLFGALEPTEAVEKILEGFGLMTLRHAVTTETQTLKR